MELKYGELFEEWEISIAVKLVGQFRARWRVLGREDFEDLLQECLTHWFFRRDKYDPSRRANRRTFMGSVLTKKLEDLAKARMTDLRKASYGAYSLDAPIREGESERTFMDLIDDSTAEVNPEEAIFLIPLRVRIKRALDKLSDKEQMLCELRMKGLTMRDAYELMGISKDEAYKLREHIRKVCKNERIEGYFK